VLVFWRCDGFFHGDGIAWGNKAIEMMGKKTGAWTTDCTDDYAALTAENLAKYDAVIFNNSTSLKPSPEVRKALLDFVEGGRGLVGIHSAADNFYDWKEGAKMMGGLFSGHPWGSGGTWAIKISEPNHPMVKCFGGQGFKIKDELYQYKEPYTRADRIVLLQIDLSDQATGEAGKKGNRADGDYAMAWVKLQGKGRVFYNGLGHNPDPFCNKAIEQFNLEGIQFALGDLDIPATPKK
jgi:type 1 glutamine amidotransferase